MLEHYNGTLFVSQSSYKADLKSSSDKHLSLTLLPHESYHEQIHLWHPQYESISYLTITVGLSQ